MCPSVCVCACVPLCVCTYVCTCVGGGGCVGLGVGGWVCCVRFNIKKIEINNKNHINCIGTM